MTLGDNLACFLRFLLNSLTLKHDLACDNVVNLLKMKRFLLVFSLLTFALAMVFDSCKKEENFSVVPVISFKEFKKFGNDSATCTINFTDGDGDIGLEQYDTVAPYNTGSKYHYNFYLVYYYQDSTGIWKPYDTKPSTPRMDTLMYTYRIPNLTQDGQKKSLQGEIKVRLNAPYAIPGQNPFKFKITLIDRALHVSNEVDTGPLTQ